MMGMPGETFPITVETLTARKIRPVSVTAPAKLNLVLGVGPRRTDGYHELATLFCALDLRDTLHARRLRPEDDEEYGEVRLAIVSDAVAGADVLPVDDRNLVVAACRRLQRAFDVREGIDLELHKAIPVAAGLAGGSADAAAALVAANAVWALHLTREELGELAAELGSDVPFALHGGVALGHGRGDRITPVPSEGRLHFVLACSDEGLSTPQVYGELDRLREAGRGGPATETVPEALLAAISTGDLEAVGPLLHNDMQAAAISLRPELGITLRTGQEAGARAALVSGSGPTCAFLVGSADEAADVARALRDGDRGRTGPVVVCSAPDVGARVVETGV